MGFSKRRKRSKKKRTRKKRAGSLKGEGEKCKRTQFDFQSECARNLTCAPKWIMWDPDKSGNGDLAVVGETTIAIEDEDGNETGESRLMTEEEVNQYNDEFKEEERDNRIYNPDAWHELHNRYSDKFKLKEIYKHPENKYKDTDGDEVFGAGPSTENYCIPKKLGKEKFCGDSDYLKTATGMGNDKRGCKTGLKCVKNGLDWENTWCEAPTKQRGSYDPDAEEEERQRQLQKEMAGKEESGPGLADALVRVGVKELRRETGYLDTSQRRRDREAYNWQRRGQRKVGGKRRTKKRKRRRKRTKKKRRKRKKRTRRRR